MKIQFSHFFSTLIYIFISVLTCLLVTTSAVQPASKTWYVSPSGNDKTLSLDIPLKTLAAACEKAKDGDKIVLSIGQYVETQPCFLKNNLLIQGSGKSNSTNVSDRTTIIGTTFGDIQSIDGLTLDNIRFEGNNTINVLMYSKYNDYPKNIQIKNSYITGYKRTVLWLENVTNFSVTDSIIKDTASEDNTQSLGSFTLKNSQNILFERNEFITTYLKGYGIKSVNSANNFVIRSNKFNMYPYSRYGILPYLWSNIENLNPNFNIEFWCHSSIFSISKIIIENNIFDNEISFPGCTKPDSQNYAIIFRNNTMVLKKGPNAKGIALELGANSIAIENNFFDMTQTVAASVFENWNTNDHLQYIRIIGNVIDGTQFKFLASSASMENLTIANNTFVKKPGKYGDWYAFITYKGSVANQWKNKSWRVVNNLLVVPQKIGESFAYTDARKNSSLPNYSSARNNLVVYTNSRDLTWLKPWQFYGKIIADPKPLQNSGDTVRQKYLPVWGSPAIDGGVNIGLPFGGKVPDIGAIERY
ncbi:right-handed parallel beta-helix repeat-containing protein [Desmonostoc muscorum LEGE 12446]|uniref:Right-handed parallel beta-helix repeat-containing protein n=1 Tax=Desmonostoc muscorum LEGE 12446 TaxID=1828758 RepID=A0A8J7A4V1_DESMC|nr:right-handed parallel beta-helix repeat-containing protein [Desmonostoc muscorum]MCF2146322.1 right-handed parallel beta-helix repeat-containing protein [Desmonostoc muscorum LEGE 12446]